MYIIYFQQNMNQVILYVVSKFKSNIIDMDIESYVADGKQKFPLANLKICGSIFGTKLMCKVPCKVVIEKCQTNLIKYQNFRIIKIVYDGDEVYTSKSWFIEVSHWLVYIVNTSETG